MSNWLDDHRQQELQAFRARFTVQQWAAFKNGYCSHARVTGEGATLLCLHWRRHGRVLCDTHVREVRQAGEFHPHMTSVPTAVASMDISEVS